jgi:hypothetical protein
VTFLEAAFPGLRPGTYQVTSPVDGDYNCIAWSVSDTRQWLWPGDPGFSEWPPPVPRERTLAAFELLYAWYGYTATLSADHEAGFEKVALYATLDGLPAHAARQLPNGRWTSKLGKHEDIEHDLHALEGDVYGRVVRLFRRPAPG